MNDMKFEYEDDMIRIGFENDIIRIDYLLDKTITEDIATYMVEKRHELTKGRKYKMIGYYTQKTSISPKASKVFASPKSKSGVIAMALVAPYKKSFFIADYFFRIVVSKKELPSRIFKDVESAKAWLKSLDEKP